jgi:hypothetical protein
MEKGFGPVGFVSVLALIALALIVAVLVVLPFVGFLEFLGGPPFERVEKYQDYGAWLAGALTPLLILVGLISWWSEKSGQDRANHIRAQTLVLTNVHELYGRINYMAFCAREGQHPGPQELQWGNLQEVMRLLDILKSRGAELDQIRRHHYFKQLARDLKRTTELIDAADLRFLIDERIFELHRAMSPPGAFPTP